MTSEGANPLSAGLLEELRSSVRGTVALSGTPAYDAALPWNRSVLFDPAAVVYVKDSDDVAAVLKFAATAGCKVTVQATGHGAVDRGRDTLVIHTADLNACIIDPIAGTAHIGAGVIASDLLEAAAEHGLAPVVGSAATVGVVGYLSGGGVGPLAATFGLSADYVRSLNVVTADGESRHVTAMEEPELFWALRGGKSALGVVTSVELELVKLTHLYGGALYFAGDSASEVVRQWATWSASLPDELTTSLALMRVPDAPMIPPVLAGRLVVAIRIGTTLPQEEADKLLIPLRSVAPPILDTIERFEYRHIGRIHNEPVDPEPLIQSQSLLSAFPEEAAEQLVSSFVAGRGTALGVVEVRRFGGVLAQPPEHPSAFSYRSAPYSLSALGFAPAERRTPMKKAVTSFLADLAPWSMGRILANFVATTDPILASMAFDQQTGLRLSAMQARYDPARLMTP